MSLSRYPFKKKIWGKKSSQDEAWRSLSSSFSLACGALSLAELLYAGRSPQNEAVVGSSWLAAHVCVNYSVHKAVIGRTISSLYLCSLAEYLPFYVAVNLMWCAKDALRNLPSLLSSCSGSPRRVSMMKGIIRSRQSRSGLGSPDVKPLIAVNNLQLNYKRMIE